MQIHGPSGSFSKIPVRLNGSGGSFAVIEFGDAAVYVETAAECDEIIKAAALAKSLLLGETSEPSPGLDATLSPPGAPARDTDGTPPGHQLPAGDVTGWDAPLPPYPAKGGLQCQNEASDNAICTAQEGHAGPLHIAYGPNGEVYGTWPQDAEVPDGSDA